MIKIKLKKRPTKPTIIEGFPGFGLIGTITTEFLVDHLKTEQIGKMYFDDMPAMVAIHNGKVVDPIGIFYSKEYNMIILHVITNITGIEWEFSQALVKLAKELKAKEIISIEGVGSMNQVSSRAYYYTNQKAKEKVFESIGIEPLKEGIIVGATGTLLLEAENVPISCIFAETNTNLPDSKASAKIIEVLDKYLKLKVDYVPLLRQAEKFENKIKKILQQAKQTQTQQMQKQLSYVG